MYNATQQWLTKPCNEPGQKSTSLRNQHEQGLFLHFFAYKVINSVLHIPCLLSFRGSRMNQKFLSTKEEVFMYM